MHATSEAFWGYHFLHATFEVATNATTSFLFFTTLYNIFSSQNANPAVQAYDTHN